MVFDGFFGRLIHKAFQLRHSGGRKILRQIIDVDLILGGIVQIPVNIVLCDKSVHIEDTVCRRGHGHNGTYHSRNLEMVKNNSQSHHKIHHRHQSDENRRVEARHGEMIGIDVNEQTACRRDDDYSVAGGDDQKGDLDINGKSVAAVVLGKHTYRTHHNGGDDDNRHQLKESPSAVLRKSKLLGKIADSGEKISKLNRYKYQIHHTGGKKYRRGDDRIKETAGFLMVILLVVSAAKRNHERHNIQHRHESEENIGGDPERIDIKHADDVADPLGKHLIGKCKYHYEDQHDRQGDSRADGNLK